MDFEGETVPLDNGESFHVYADSCMVCNQQCYLRPSFPAESPLSQLERERIMEIRGIIYQAFDIQVGHTFVQENKSELPLCSRCTFKLGQLRHVHFQLAALQREYNKLREEIAFSIVDLVAGSEGSKSFFADIGSKSPASILRLIKESEVETIQHLVFENWHERYSEDEPEEPSPKKAGVVNLPSLTMKPEKIKPNILRNRRKSVTQSVQGRIGSATITPVKAETPAVSKSKSSLPTPTSSSSASTSAAAKISSSVKVESGTATASTTKIISITTSKDNTLASVEVSNEDQEVEDINEGIVNDEESNNDNAQDDAMVIAMSPTQFCPPSECSSPDPSHFLQGGDSENELDALDDNEDLNLPLKIRKFDKIKTDANGSLKFPNDLEVTEWSSDDSQSQHRGLDYDIFDNDDGSQDFEGIVGGSKRMRLARDLDMSVDNNSLGHIEFQQNEEGLYVCMFCTKTFIHKYPYRDHLKTHTGEGPRCPVCNKIFPKNHNLMLHMRTHTGEKPYKCMVCGKGFADKSNLKVHMRVHTGERPYKCEYCDQAFVNSSRLVVHRRLHTGEKPFMCDLCNRCFGTSNQLQTHKKIHYEEKGFKCNDCGKSYTSATTLQAHVALAH